LPAQIAAPYTIGRAINLIPPAIDATGRTAVFGSASAPDGTTGTATNLYTAGTDGSGARIVTPYKDGNIAPFGVTAASLSPDGARAAITVFKGFGAGNEEVHVVDVASGKDQTVAIDTLGCIQPLCVNCFFTCIRTPHVFQDGVRIIYASTRTQPFYVVNADGTNPKNLRIYSGSLAPGPQRVISRDGTIVFTSSAPYGVTLTPAATDVFVTDPEGINILRVTSFPDASIYARNAVIAADRSVIVFESNYDPVTGGQSATPQIFVVRADGTGLRVLTAGPDAATGPSLSADGLLMAFTQGGQAYLLRVDGRSLKVPLTKMTLSVVQDVVLSDDGTRVAFTVGPAASQPGAIEFVDSGGTNLRTVYAPRSISPGGVASIIAGVAPSAGSMISIFGTNFAPLDSVTATGLPWPKSLAGVSLAVNQNQVPIEAVTPWQVNAQLPQDIPAGPATFQIQFADGRSTPVMTAEVKSTAPAVFAYPASVTPNAFYFQAAAFHAGTAIAADAEHPAKAGETLEFYGTGLGATNPRVDAGTAAPGNPPAMA
jgi:uncharacterized protein (TIGR03437 family)